jgi:hypothetical protein
MSERAALIAELERRTGGKVSVAPEVIVGFGKARATLHGGEPVLLSATVRGSDVDALRHLLSMLAKGTA